MGNSNLQNQFKSGKWQLIQTIGNRQILQNIQTHQQIQKHFSISNFKSLQQRYEVSEIYRWRKQLDQNVNVVKLFHYDIKQYNFGFQQDQYVYTEKINRLNQKAKQYSKPQGFLLIMNLLTGLDLLFSQFGLFNIDVFLLGVSLKGIGKVWINQNFAKNYINQQHKIKIINPNQQLVIVNNLIRIVKEKIYNEEFMPSIEFPYNMTCKKAIQYIKNVRKNNVMFKVNKIYLNRNQFKNDYDILLQIYLASQNSKQQIIDNSQLKNKQVKLINQNNFRHSYFSNNSQQNSQTLSSDSNSRAKKSQIIQNIDQRKTINFPHFKYAFNEFKIRQIQNHPTMIVQQINFNQIQQNKLSNEIKQLSNLQKINKSLEAQVFNKEFQQSAYNFPTLIKKNQPNVKFHQQIMFNSPKIENEKKYIQRDVLLISPQNIQQIKKSSKNFQHQFKLRGIQRFSEKVQRNLNFLIYEAPLQILPTINEHQPQKFVAQHPKIYRQVIRRQKQQPRKPFMQNVELCESVILDKKDLHQKMQDFQN